VHEAASLLVAYLIALPKPLLATHRDGFLACSQLLALVPTIANEAEGEEEAATEGEEEAKREAMQEAMKEARQTNLRCLVADLPGEASCLLERLLRTLAVLLRPEHTCTNGLSEAFVARIFAPILLRSEDHNEQQQKRKEQVPNGSSNGPSVSASNLIAKATGGADSSADGSADGSAAGSAAGSADDPPVVEGDQELDATEMLIREQSAALVHVRSELRRGRDALRKKVEWWSWLALQQRLRPLCMEVEEDARLVRRILQELEKVVQEQDLEKVVQEQEQAMEEEVQEGEGVEGDGSSASTAGGVNGGVEAVDLGEANIDSLLLSEVWARCSFTPNDPLADFNGTINGTINGTRGGGRLAAECFLFFLQRYPANARSMVGTRAGARGAAEKVAHSGESGSVGSGDSGDIGGSGEGTDMIMANESSSRFPLVVGGACVLQAMLQLLQLLPSNASDAEGSESTDGNTDADAIDAAVGSVGPAAAVGSVASDAAGETGGTGGGSNATLPTAAGSTDLSLSVLQELWKALDPEGHMLHLASRPWWRLLDDPHAVEALYAVGLVLLDHHFKLNQRQQANGMAASISTVDAVGTVDAAGADFNKVDLNKVVDCTVRVQIEALLTSSTPAPESVEDVWRIWCTLRARQMEAEAEGRMQATMRVQQQEQQQEQHSMPLTQIEETSKALGYAEPPEGPTNRATNRAINSGATAGGVMAGGMIDGMTDGMTDGMMLPPPPSAMDTPPSSDDDNDEESGNHEESSAIGWRQQEDLFHRLQSATTVGSIVQTEQHDLAHDLAHEGGADGADSSGADGSGLVDATGPTDSAPSAGVASAPSAAGGSADGSANPGADGAGGEVKLMRKRCVRGGEYYFTQLRSPTDTLSPVHGLPGGALELLEQALPGTYQGYDWVRKYSLAKHGASLHSFLERVQVRSINTLYAANRLLRGEGEMRRWRRDVVGGRGGW
jgi:hypothetical protein